MAGPKRIALVTGGGRGIGRAIALALAEDGADVALSYRRDAEAAEQTLAEIRAFGRRGLACRASQEDFQALAHLVDEVTGELGPIDLLVNNAGIASRGQDVVHTESAEVERVLRIHSMAPHELCKLVIPGMRERQRGDIIMISSVATRAMSANGAPYAMGKAAMEALAFVLAKEEQANGIRVNVVAPGLVETEMGRRLMKATSGVDDLRTLDAVMPFGRVCRPEDVAGVVRALVSDRFSYVSGQRIYVEGAGS